MLNLNMGAPANLGGRSCIATGKGRVGHAVYGPYDYLEPGRYVVEFNIEPVADQSTTEDFLCAVVDVVYDVGKSYAASKDIYYSQLRSGRTAFTLTFDARENARYEYRVWVNGSIPLQIDEYRPIIRIPEGASDLQAVLAEHRFPGDEGLAVPFFAENQAMLRNFYERGIGVGIVRGSVVLTIDGISLFARSTDDLTFLGELFYERAYDFRIGRPACVIDIGMNIGLASLMFAQKPEVAEVHAFEPFRNTFDRANDNLGLNPTLAAKIDAANYGLSDRNDEGTVKVDPNADSGAMTTVGVTNGAPVHVTLRDAGPTLKPIVEAARAKGLAIVMKVDCEGSEFAIFRSLERTGLLPLITAFMVEWHAMFEGKTQHDLIAPLKAHGFVVFDRSPPTGNGFFYAARIGAAA